VKPVLTISGETASPREELAPPPRRSPSRRSRSYNYARLTLTLTIILGTALGGGYLAYKKYQVIRLSKTVRELTETRRYEECRQPLRMWLATQPSSAEAHYYQARLALANNQPHEASEAIDQARKLGFDRALLDCIVAIMQSLSGQYNEAEPYLRQAFNQDLEPKVDVARELAHVYLSTYRLGQASVAIERWRNLAPEDARPYLWSNEIESRSDAVPAILIRNYRAALERDPTLDKARLGLAEQLSKDRRLEEADEEFSTYLKRNPNDPAPLVGLGSNAFQRGEIQTAIHHFEAALKLDPRLPKALKELAQAELRLGRYQQARQHLETLTEIEPFEHENHYNLARALRLLGDEKRFKIEDEIATRLRKEHDEMAQLQTSLLRKPNDLDTRFEVTRWMFSNGHFQEGLDWSKEILRTQPAHVPTHRLLASYYEKQGNPGLANYHRLMAASGQEKSSSTTAKTP
jgi:predicted Zn-dependent protease